MRIDERWIMIDDCDNSAGSEIICRSVEFGVMALNAYDGRFDGLRLDYSLENFGRSSTGDKVLDWIEFNPIKAPKLIAINSKSDYGQKALKEKLERMTTRNERMISTGKPMYLKNDRGAWILQEHLYYKPKTD